VTAQANVLIDLSANESPLPPSPAVLSAIAREAEHLNRYPPRDERLPEALASHYGRGLAPGHFLAAASGSEVLELLARAHLRPGDEAIISTPTFPVYAKTIERQGATIVDAPLEPDTFSFDLGRILNAITPRTRLLYLCNPGNPTGVITTRGACDELVGAMPSHVTLVIDEVYHHFVDRPGFPDAIQYVLEGRPVVVVHSFSKVFGLAGLRLGYGIAPPVTVERMARYKLDFHLGRLAVAAGLAALGDAAYRGRVLDAVRGGKEYLYHELARLGITFWRSHANFVLIRPPQKADAHRALLNRGVRVRPTEGNGLPGHLRVTVGLPEENRRFIAALEEVLAACPT
jgi:histidinol-phosphate aminotransferase